MFRLYTVFDRESVHTAEADYGNSAPRHAARRRRLPFHGRRSLVSALSVAAYLSCMAACGDDSNDAPITESTPDAGAGKDNAGSGGSGGAGGNMSVAPPEPVPCGSVMCNPPNNPLSGIASMFGAALGGALPSSEACCIDESAGTCGVTADMGATCEPSAVPDERCPGADLGMLGSFLGGANMVGCCIDNMCGQDGAMFGRGCVPNAEAQSMVSSLPLIGGMIMFPPTLACDRPEDMEDADAGVTDAGPMGMDDQDAGL